MTPTFLDSWIAKVRLLNAELDKTINKQKLINEEFQKMSDLGDQLKAQIAEIGNDVTEIDGDLDEVIDKLNQITGLPTLDEFNEIKGMLTDLKGRTAATAAKVPEPPTP